MKKMYQKKHLVITAVITALIVSLSTTAFFNARFGDDGGKLLKARNMIQEYYVDELTQEQLTAMDDAAISAMVDSLGDPYSRYLNESAFSEYQEDNEEEYIGIGISVSFSLADNTLTVMSPYDNSPAQKAGILPGDIIVSVDGVKVTTDTYNDVIDYIRGKNAVEGDSLVLTVARGEARETKEITVAREKIEIETVTSKMFGGGVGYIRVAQFINSTSENFEKAIKQLKADGMKGLIIDLRSNPGGYAHTVLDMADMLLPEGTIAYLEDNKGNQKYFESDAEELGLPMVILINGGTASASELLAGSVQAYGLATLVGEKSFGKAVGQSPLPLTSKSAIYLTNARYYTPKGECIDKKGIEPDVKVELSEELQSRLPLLTLSEDTQLSKAIDILTEKIGA